MDVVLTPSRLSRRCLLQNKNKTSDKRALSSTQLTSAACCRVVCLAQNLRYDSRASAPRPYPPPDLCAKPLSVQRSPVAVGSSVEAVEDATALRATIARHAQAVATEAHRPGDTPVYAISKVGVNFYTQLCARALGPRLRVNACSPGFCRTEIAGPSADYSKRFPSGKLAHHST